MRRSTKLVGGSALAVLVVLLILAGADRQRAVQQQQILADIAFGKTIGGSLHSASGQFVCLNVGDAARGAYGVDTSPAADEIRDQLVKSWRCMVTGPEAGFTMTADGRERFVTPDGAIELWAG